MNNIKVGDRFIFKDQGYDDLLEAILVEDPGISDKITFKILENRGSGNRRINEPGQNFVQYAFQKHFNDGVYIYVPKLQDRPHKSRLELIND